MLWPCSTTNYWQKTRLQTNSFSVKANKKNGFVADVSFDYRARRFYDRQLDPCSQEVGRLRKGGLRARKSREEEWKEVAGVVTNCFTQTVASLVEWKKDEMVPRARRLEQLMYYLKYKELLGTLFWRKNLVVRVSEWVSEWVSVN